VTRWKWSLTTAALISAVTGIAFDVLPRNWIELWLGIDPDGGNAALESLLISLPVAIAAGIAVLAFRLHLAGSSDAPPS
jgi:hypothetical protein